MEKWLSEIKEFFDLRTDVVVTFCVASGLFIWKIKLTTYGEEVRDFSTVIFVITSVFLIVRLVISIYETIKNKLHVKSLRKKRVDFLQSLNIAERWYIKKFLQPEIRVQSGRGPMASFLYRQGVISYVSVHPRTGTQEYELSDWALEILEDDPSLIDDDESKDNKSND